MGESPKRSRETADREAEKRADAQGSVIDSLIEIRHRQRRLAEYRTRALEMREKIDGQVYRKVLSDYEARHGELEKSAAALIAQAKTEYQKLSAEWARVTRASEQAKMAAAEAVFRHAVGEIDDAELAERVRSPEQVQATCVEQLALLGAQKARFAEALPGLDLDQWRESDPRPPSDEIKAEIKNDATAIKDDTNTMMTEQLMSVAKAGERKPPEDRRADDLTMILPDAVLVGTETPSSRFRLAVANYIGRSEDNQVRLSNDDVSQRHALIMATGSGFVVKDLQSRNGTFVNGERIQERTLTDGDRIKVGSSELTFHMPASNANRSVP